MSETTILVPVRYPLEEQNVRTIKKALDIAEQQGDAVLSILHINVIHKNERVTRDDLVSAVESKFGRLANARYEVSKAFLLEEAILNEAIQQKAEYVVIGKDRRARWRRILSSLLGKNVHIESFLQKHLNANLVVV
jgi:K+-sensing histidine kinase KdpD